MTVHDEEAVDNARAAFPHLDYALEPATACEGAQRFPDRPVLGGRPADPRRGRISGQPTLTGRGQPLYCATILVKSQLFWLTLLQAPSAQPCGTLGSQTRSRLSDQ